MNIYIISYFCSHWNLRCLHHLLCIFFWERGKEGGLGVGVVNSDVGNDSWAANIYRLFPPKEPYLCKGLFSKGLFSKRDL